jgi:hypothetical protein
MRDTNLRFTLTTEHGTWEVEQVKPADPTATHCELCGRPNPGNNDGYTACCDELFCDGGTCVWLKSTDRNGHTSTEHHRSRAEAIDQNTPTAYRAETDPCEKGTPGCSVRHSAISIETNCQTW